MPTYSLDQDLAGMQHGEERHLQTDAGDYHVRYESEQAMGDNGYPARGYTIGYYHVTGPSGTRSFRHSPHGPTLEGAKPYAAKQAAEHIISAAFEAKHRDVHPRKGRLGM
jgi:hypothetical protein